MKKENSKIFTDIQQERLFRKNDKVIVACSGGPDSVALLDILNRIKSILNLKIVAAYFNHGLRPEESKKEIEYVKGLCAGFGLEFVSGRGDVKSFAKRYKVSIQEAGRKLRYDFLFELAKKMDIQKIALGHHRDDIVETALLGLFKGGPKSLSGIDTLRKRDKFQLIRPMCDVSKEQILSYISKRKLKPCIDSSNLKDKYLRNRLRLKILPILRKDINPRVDDAVLRLTDIYARESEYIDKAVSKIINKLISEKGSKIYLHKNQFLKLHIALQRRLLREIFMRIGIIGEGNSFRQIESLRNFISDFHPGQRLDLARGFTAKGVYGRLIIEKKYADKKQKKNAGLLKRLVLNVPGETVAKELGILIKAEFSDRVPSLNQMKKAFPDKVYLDREKIKNSLYIRTRRQGDSFRPLGMKGTAKLKEFFIDRKIPQQERKFIPLVLCGKEIVWVAGHAISEKIKIDSSTKKILMLSIKRLQ